MRLLKIDHALQTPCPEADPDQTDLHRLWGADLKQLHLNSGKLYGSTWGQARITVRDSRERPKGLADYMNTVPFRVVSAKLVSIMKSFNCQCEYLPLIATYRRQKYVDQFFALNVLNVTIDGLDKNKSVFGFFDEDIDVADDIEKLVLKEEISDTVPITFLRQIGHLLVNDLLADAIASEGIVGLTPIDIAHYSRYGCI